MVTSHGRLLLITGGARSGKSSFAEQLALRLAAERGGAAERDAGIIYVATSEANDEEMAARVATHRAARPSSWTTIECPLDVPAALRRHIRVSERREASGGPADGAPIFLLDCVTVWVSNLLFAGGSFGGTRPPEGFNYDDSLLNPEQERAVVGRVTAAVDDLLAAVAETHASLIAVTNEVGLGVVPEYPLARLYRDQLGWANQRLARAADSVYFLVSGYAMDVRRLASSWPDPGGALDGSPDSTAVRSTLGEGPDR